MDILNQLSHSPLRALRRLRQSRDHHWLWLGLAIVLAVLPHGRQTPTWIPVVCLLLVGIKLILVYGIQHSQRARWLGMLMRNTLAVLLVLGVYLHYDSLLGRDAGVALLIVLSGFKFLEARRARDLYVSTALGFFLIVTNFFYSQTIGTAVYMAPIVILLVMALLDINDPQRALPVLNKLQRAGIMLLQAVPLMLILFFLFPRVAEPLWGMPEDAFTGTTGLDDIMTPGSISQLSDTNDVAFRVEFHGETPPASARYWRGPVLWDTDGRVWLMGQQRERGKATATQRGNGIDYTLMLEPHDRKWIYALEMPVDIPDGTRLNHDYQLLDDDTIRKRRQYDLTGYTDYRLTGADQVDFERALALPPAAHPKAVALARQWRDEGLDTDAIVDRALGMFHNQTFYYSTTPPLLTGDVVDEFLFETKEGFCEHYAAAFTVLMRAAGIPARIVMGYQGGTLNPVGGYYVVYQRDAHAWTEVWMNDSWQRVDPTAAVSPARIRDGLDGALPDTIAQPLGLDRNSWVGRTLLNLRDNWDALNTQWNQWVLGYTQSRQRVLLNRMGIDYRSWQDLAVWLAAIMGIVIVITAVVVLVKPRDRTDSARRLYNRFCRKLARAGMSRNSYEGPRDFAVRARRRFPACARSITEITERYIAIRYANQSADRDELKQLRTAIGAFRPAVY